MATDDLKARLRTPHSSLATQSFIMNEAADALTTLEAQLAARDAEIAAWLRGEVAYELAANSEHDDLLKLADAIASGDYAKGQTDAQQGD